MSEWQSFTSHVSHLECSATGERYEAGKPHNTSRAGKPLIVRYDLKSVARSVDPAEIARRPADLWRYRELLPVRRPEDVVSLGEQFTPLLPLAATSRRIGGGELLVKDEGRLPTGSFKARGLAVAVSMAKSFGATRIAMPTVGSGGASLAAYCRRAGIDSVVFCPEDSPSITVSEIAFYGAKVYLANGALRDCNRLVAEGCASVGWFDMTTLKEPYRIEGKKTMGLELADQLGWQLPDVIFYPTGGGTGFIGMWKAFAELGELGWIGAKRPRMVAVQTTGCCPIVRAFEKGHREIETPWTDIRTNVHGVRVAKALGDFLILRAMYESGGFGVAVTDEDVEATRAAIARDDGILLSPEGAACVAAYREALTSGRVKPGERAVAFNTATGLRTAMPMVDRRVDVSKPVDYAAL
ncbi:MAG: threonine synthase [Alphaproteobacteria bacterium]|nr:threonine synthase [Alphaproteobacteria bacterium]